MSVEIEPLLAKVEAVAPRFGRASDDLKAMAARGRAGDYKGVLQNARLVVETLLRALVTEDLKQTPGKATLDQLVSKFREQANQGVLPTNILAHVGTVQAWGNLSSHDHSGSLSDPSVTVGTDEVVASLNSVLAILSWYSQKKALGPPITQSHQALSPVPAEAPASAVTGAKRRGPLAVGLLAGLGLLGAIAWALARGEAPEAPVAPAVVAATPADLAALDAVYARRDEPPPPSACRAPADLAQLARSADDAEALALIEAPSAEAAYLLARARFEQSKARAPALDVALRCEGFAAAWHLAGLVALTEGRTADARAAFEKARAAAPSWLDNRAKLAGLLLKSGEAEAAAAEIDQLFATRADYAPAFFLRFAARMAEGRREEALADLCRAAALGSAQAAEQVGALAVQCR